ncbi:hypothetical protein Pint_07817 [Pistacia integerrima]|uniref:Uncharacterized protein n=1 Tax=Pistacia integerrima TaxID=434235 RepID=A0ACC0XV17_9ROSI|nr:hypothetical protein Pint_07817 [Pistacia integerrima]
MDTKKMGLILGLLGFFFLDGLLLCMARPQIRYYDFVLQESNFTKLCSTKSLLTVNGSFPGPTIKARRGDTVIVNVHNQGKYGVTIHWHGVKQPRNPWSDGPENITQCPIKPGANFTYEVILSTEEGTLWWHAHTSWYKQDVQAMITNSIETGVNPSTSDAFTINGKPGDRYNCSSDSIYRLKVKYGKTYLLRIVNAVMNEEHFFAIAKHNLTVVGQDGAYIKPINTNYIMITPGQTMDILFTANQNLSHYYMASAPFFDSTVAFNNSTTTAVVQYEGKYSAPSSPFFPNLPFYNNTEAAEYFTKRVRSLASKEHPINVPKNITTRIYISVALNRLLCPNNSCNTTAGDRQSASLNNITQGTKARMINYGEVVEIVYQNTNLGAPESHPMHLHGFSFYLVGTGSGNFNNVTDPSTYNLVDPPELNTINLPKNGWAAIRFIAENPGVWFLHCHLERHGTWGMDTVLIVKNGKSMDQRIRRPPAHMPPCS